MVGVSVKDVDQHEFVRALAAFFKRYAVPLEAHIIVFTSIFFLRSGKMSMPGYTDLVKLAKFKELAPADPDWYYTRAASIARHLYFRAPAGVGAFTKIYGGNFSSL